jgi:hypothetical protein
MKIFKIVALGFFLTFCFSNCTDKNKGFHYEVEAKNGGPNGFNIQFVIAIRLHSNTAQNIQTQDMKSMKVVVKMIFLKRY